MKADIQSQKDVITELKAEPSVNPANIGVEVTGGVVTLVGHIDSYSEKWNSEKAAQGVAGVKALTIEVTVNLPGASARADSVCAQSTGEILQGLSPRR